MNPEPTNEALLSKLNDMQRLLEGHIQKSDERASKDKEWKDWAKPAIENMLNLTIGYSLLTKVGGTVAAIVGFVYLLMKLTGKP